MRDADMILADATYRRLFVDDEVVVAAGAKCAFFEPVGARAAPTIVARMKRALERQEPLSLVRVGNGEGNAISLVEEPASDPIFQGFDFEFVSQNGMSIGIEEAVSFSKKVVDAIKSADIQGYRIERVDEGALARQCLATLALSPALGITYARALFYRQLCDEKTKGTWFTNAWIHFDLIDHLNELFDSAKRVFVMTGRHELEGKLRDQLGSRLYRFARVPVQGYVPQSRSDSHFEQFEEMRSLIRRDVQPGTLVLIGAGLFGKIYCQDAKDSGAVAIDMGSAFDLLAGVATRPIHRQIDLAAVRW
jgi:glycosyltransferase GT-like protein